MTPDNAAADPQGIIADLQRRLDESFAQQAATAEVLEVINSSVADPAPVLDTMLAALVFRYVHYFLGLRIK